MREPDFHPEMVGRENELNELQAYLDKAAQGQGSTIFISGEAGIGKTKLVNELKLHAQSQGFKILSGNSLSESLTPYMPFIEALRSGGLENLFAEDTPRVEAAYLVTESGLLVKKVLRKETKLEPEIFASMLTTVSNFVKESLSMLDDEKKEGGLNVLGYQDYRILIEGGVNINLVVVLSGRENEFLINDMREILTNVNKRYGNMLKDWRGYEDMVHGIEQHLEPLITSGKYDGLYYGKDDPKARRNLLFENVFLGLHRQVLANPTLLCIEDLQWADPSSLSLMHYVSRNTRQGGLLILGTYRPEDVAVTDDKGHPLTDTMRLMDREDLYEELKLQRLPKEVISEFLSLIFSNFDFDDRFKDRIYGDTEGNPLFIIHLIKFLVEENIIRKDNGTWKLTKVLEDLDIPSKIYNVIARRLERVEKEDRKVLDYASVIGGIFTSRVLVEALRIEKMELLERLKVLEKTHRLINSINGKYKFDHAKIKEVLYSEIPHELRMEYHAVIADSIEILNKDDLDEVVGDLAFHYYHCRNNEKALHYLMKAAEKAKKEYSNEEAIRFYTQVLDLEEDMQKRRETFEAMGDIYFLMGDYGKSMESYKSALELTKEKNKSSEIMAKIGQIHQRKGEFEETIRICTEALELVKGEDCEEEVLCLGSISFVHVNRGDSDKALELLEKGLAIREKIGYQMGIARSLNSIGYVYHQRGDYDKVLEFNEKSLAIMEKIGDQTGIANSLHNIANVHFFRGDYDKALEFYEKGLAIREKIGYQMGIAHSLHNIANVHVCIGYNDKALALHEKSLEISEKLGDQMGIANSLNSIGIVHTNKGDCDKALEVLEKSQAISEKIGHKEAIGWSLNSIGNVQSNRGDYDKALALYKKSLAISDEIGDKSTTTENYCGLAKAYLMKKDFVRATEFCEKAFNLSKEIDAKEYIGNSKRIFGMILSEQGNWDLSAENFEEGIRILADIGRNFDLGGSRHEFGLMWKAKGENDKAKEQLNKSLEIFEKLKLDKRIEQVRAALKDL
jgi:predicted ATPase